MMLSALILSLILVQSNAYDNYKQRLCPSVSPIATTTSRIIRKHPEVDLAFQKAPILCTRKKHNFQQISLRKSITHGKRITKLFQNLENKSNTHHENHGKSDHGINNSYWKGLASKPFMTEFPSFIASLGLAITITLFFLPQPSIADITTSTTSPTESSSTTSIEQSNLKSTPDSSSSQPRKSRYWSIMNDDQSDIQQIMAANEKLLDHAVGTINTMYYDNSGGANFSPKDMYDRWKVLRVYGKEGVDGVRDLNARENAKRQQQQKQQQQREDDGIKNENSEINLKDKAFYGNGFSSSLFSIQGDSVKMEPRSSSSAEFATNTVLPDHVFDNRENAVTGLKWLVSTLNDPYSKYLTREELQKELSVRDDGFLGLGVIVETPPQTITLSSRQGATNIATTPISKQQQRVGTSSTIPTAESNGLLTSTRVANLPMVTAVVPDSPAERAGILTGDRIAAIGSDKFLGLGRDEISKKINGVYSGAENYIGYLDFTVVKPVFRGTNVNNNGDIVAGPTSVGFKLDGSSTSSSRNYIEREEVIGYKLAKVRLPTLSVQPFTPYKSEMNESPVSGGDAIVHWNLLTPNDSIFRKSQMESSSEKGYVGYIRLTRFSRSATAGYLNAINELEKAGAQSYIIDVRNNFGGVIQESMLTAATLLRDPHTVLCYTMNSRGGFTPHDAEEYIVDKRYPGYLLSSEDRSVTLEQVKRDDPEFVNEDGNLQWVPPSSYASLHEQRMKRGIQKASSSSGIAAANAFDLDSFLPNRRKNKDIASEERKQLNAQKKVVILMNDGTASAAEVFVSSLHDNGRTVALVGTNTFGKGLIQHTFPMPDGGGLRLTVAEYLTPALQHVTKVGSARYDPSSDTLVRGGLRPDVYCPSKQGIPSNIGADICVGLALDAIEDADVEETRAAMSTDGVDKDGSMPVVGRKGGADGGSGRRKTFTQGIARDDF